MDELVTNVSVSLNVNVTNNLDGDFTDAVLVINENNCIGPVTFGGSGIGPDGTASGCTAGFAPDERFQDPQFGELASATRIEWNGIHFPVPGGPSAGYPAASDCTDGFIARSGDTESECNPDITVVRITSMRGNAS